MCVSPQYNVYVRSSSLLREPYVLASDRSQCLLTFDKFLM